MSAPPTEREIGRILRRLGSGGARLRPAPGSVYRIETGGEPAKQMRVDAETVAELRRRDLVEGADDALVLSPTGRAFLRRALAGGDFRAQHGELEPATIVDDDGASRQITVDRGESPLAWLRSRRGRDGRPMVDAVEFAAGERLRSDYTRGNMMPRVTANWSAAVAGGRRDGAGGMADLTDAALAARRRVERAVAAVGPDLGGLLVDFCCFLKGLEDIEREHLWPPRSAKVVLRMALSALARHYGLAAKAHGPPRLGIVHWGTEDYRPVLE